MGCTYTQVLRLNTQFKVLYGHIADTCSWWLCKGTPTLFKDTSTLLKNTPTQFKETLALCKDTPTLFKDTPALFKDTLALFKDTHTLFKDMLALCKDTPTLSKDTPTLSLQLVSTEEASWTRVTLSQSYLYFTLVFPFSATSYFH